MPVPGSEQLQRAPTSPDLFAREVPHTHAWKSYAQNPGLAGIWQHFARSCHSECCRVCRIRRRPGERPEYFLDTVRLRELLWGCAQCARWPRLSLLRPSESYKLNVQSLRGSLSLFLFFTSQVLQPASASLSLTPWLHHAPTFASGAESSI